MLRGVESAVGLASGFSLMWKGSPRFPSPLTALGNCWRMSSFVCMPWSLAISCKAQMAGSPSRLFCSPLTT